MFTVRFENWKDNGIGVPSSMAEFSIHEARSVHMRTEKDGRKVLQLNSAPADDAVEFTVGAGSDCAFRYAFIMNAAGKTVDVIR
jgi:hypothetical protein